jgi:hypothetical protein
MGCEYRLPEEGITDVVNGVVCDHACNKVYVSGKHTGPRPLEDVKLVLLPLSSIGDEEYAELQSIAFQSGNYFEHSLSSVYELDAQQTVFLLNKGYDLFQLIERGEAIDGSQPMESGTGYVTYNATCGTCGHKWVAVCEVNYFKHSDGSVEHQVPEKLECPDCLNLSHVELEPAEDDNSEAQ